MGEGRDNPGGIAVPPPFLCLGALLLGLALHRVYPRPFLTDLAARSVGWTLLGCAGTPFRLDQPAEKLVTEGPFRLSRNPGYLSFTMIQGGVALFVNGLWAAVLVPLTMVVIRSQVIEKEESYLEREFGWEYLRYKARVRRWI